jgi:hypothetical protein
MYALLHVLEARHSASCEICSRSTADAERPLDSKASEAALYPVGGEPPPASRRKQSLRRRAYNRVT